MALRGIWHFDIQKGGGWDRTLTFTSNGAAYDLTVYTVGVMTITPTSGTPTVLSIANAKLINGGAAGTLQAKLTKTEIDALNWTGIIQHVLTLTPSSVFVDAIELHGIVTFYSS